MKLSETLFYRSHHNSSLTTSHSACTSRIESMKARLHNTVHKIIHAAVSISVLGKDSKTFKSMYTVAKVRG